MDPVIEAELAQDAAKEAEVVDQPPQATNLDKINQVFFFIIVLSL